MTDPVSSKSRIGTTLVAHGWWPLYLAVLIGLVLYLAQCAPAKVPPITAAAQLPAGHRLETGDVVLPGGPHYVVQEIAAGKPIAPENLTSLLKADPPKGSLAMVFKLSTAEAVKLPNSRSLLWICPSTTTDAQVPVLSAQCDTRIGTCLAVVAVPVARAAAIAALTDPKLSAAPCIKAPK